METLLALGTSLIASKFAVPALITFGVYIIGLFSKSHAYTTIRTGLGKLMYGAGKAASTFGNSKLKVFWNPIEAVIADFILFAIEQFAVGLRSDNLDKLEAQLTRLKDVDSMFRAEAVENKLEVLRGTPKPLQDVHDAAIQARMLGGLGASMDSKLKE
jgi:hypothetical protein